MFDVIVIGKGPAGISAALYTARAGRKTAVIGNGAGALEKAERIENYYGLSEPISGLELQRNGEEQARRLGVELIEGEVVGILQQERFLVETTAGHFEAKCVIITVGKARRRVDLPGVAELEGRGVSYCAVCDAFFYRNKRVAVLGSGEYAVNEARHLAGVASSVTIFTNGESPAMRDQEAFPLVTQPLAAVEGEGRVTALRLKDGTRYPVDGVFVAVGQASAIDFAQKLGVAVEKGNILVDAAQMTNCPGVFAAGDCTGGFLQVSKAVGEGAIAGQKAAEYVRKNF